MDASSPDAGRAYLGSETNCMPKKLDHLRQAYTHTLLLAGRQWRRIANPVAEAHGLSEATALPLILIHRQDAHPRQHVLAEALGIEGPSLVRLLDQLEAGGLILRMEDPTDRRAKVLSLTPEGKRIVVLMEAAFTKLRAEVLADIDTTDLEAALRVFQALQLHFRGVSDGAASREATE